MTAFELIRDHLESLIHPSIRTDALESARHRGFIAMRLLGGLAVLAASPLYLAVRGAPSAPEVMILAWLLSPILVSYYLSRTGRFERAHLLSCASLAAVVLAVSLITGGMSSFAAIWLIAVPLEGILSASRRVVAVALTLALGCALVLIGAEVLHVLPASQTPARLDMPLTAISMVIAMIYAAGLAICAESLTRIGKKLLDTEEGRYRLMARNISDVLSRHHANGDVSFISPASESMLGIAPIRLLGQGLFDRVHVADRPAYLKALSDAARGGDSTSVEFRVRRDGTKETRGMADFIWVEMRCRPLEPARAAELGNEVVSVIHDVTDRKEQEYALEAARQDAERAGASKAQFLATMSHELRTPLNAIIGFSEMIAREEEMKLDAARRKEYATLIHESGVHLLSLVNGILDMSKMESGKFEILPEPFSPRESLTSCCSLMALKARDRGIDLVTRMPSDLPQIVGDPRAFKQITLNLVSNAIKFTERGGSVVVSASAEGSRMILRVTDTGCGIGEDDLSRLGDPFFQAGRTYKGRQEGTGLGLSIVKSLVELHGGDIKVTSKLDEGTTVTVVLPLTAHATQPMSNVATLAPAPRSEPLNNQVKKIA